MICKEKVVRRKWTPSSLLLPSDCVDTAQSENCQGSARGGDRLHYHPSEMWKGVQVKKIDKRGSPPALVCLVCLITHSNLAAHTSSSLRLTHLIPNFLLIGPVRISSSSTRIPSSVQTTALYRAALCSRLPLQSWPGAL